MRIARPASVIFYLILALALGGGLAVIGAQVAPYGAWIGVGPLWLLIWLGLRRPLRRWRLSRERFPEAWGIWLLRHVPFYGGLSPEGRTRFEQDIQFFLNEQRFESLPGLTVTDQHKLAVAAGAALMLHGRPDWEPDAKRTILFYPDSFDDAYYGGEYATFDGMVHAQGPLILSIKAVEESWEDPHDGHNVVLHELAHTFDFLGARASGMPAFLDPISREAWSRLVKREMRKIQLGRSLLRRYAATDPAEFFAVAVENFFERPLLLKRRHAELFDALAAFFNLDPR